MRLLVIFLLLGAWAAQAAELEAPLRALAAVGREGQGNEEAGKAWRAIVAAGPAALPALLETTGAGSPVSDNWLRLAGDAIVKQAHRSHAPLPLGEVESFLKETAHRSPARQLAFDLLREADAERAAALEPSLLHDPVQELRRGAVQRLVEAGLAAPEEQRKAIFSQALEAVRDEDQTKVIAAELRRLAVPVDLPKHFGFLMQWQVIGPFDNNERKGYDAVFPPEKEVQLEREYQGKTGPVRWQPFTSTDEYGTLDFNKPLGLLKETTAYAVTTFVSAEERPAELRLGCKDAWKVWLNGELLFGRDEYHRGQQMDQYRMPCRLRKGANQILVKCCQNEQKETWTVEWEFQLRVCDATGTALLSQP